MAAVQREASTRREGGKEAGIQDVNKGRLSSMVKYIRLLCQKKGKGEEAR